MRAVVIQTPLVGAIKRCLSPSIRKKLPRTIAVVRIAQEDARRINQRYRGKDYAANVLSFRYSASYGEILICPVVIRREARVARRAYQEEYVRMIAHGVLHLALMHHERSPEEARTSKQWEERMIACCLGLKKGSSA